MEYLCAQNIARMHRKTQNMYKWYKLKSPFIVCTNHHVSLESSSLMLFLPTNPLQGHATFSQQIFLLSNIQLCCQYKTQRKFLLSHSTCLIVYPMCNTQHPRTCTVASFKLVRFLTQLSSLKDLNRSKVQGGKVK